MTSVVIDAAMRNRLRNLTEAMQFIDESGRVLGHFLPIPEAVNPEPQISEEEIQRRLGEGGGRTLAEIMADLERRA
jgi:hypothetical protein